MGARSLLESLVEQYILSSTMLYEQISKLLSWSYPARMQRMRLYTADTHRWCRGLAQVKYDVCDLTDDRQGSRLEIASSRSIASELQYNWTINIPSSFFFCPKRAINNHNRGEKFDRQRRKISVRSVIHVPLLSLHSHFCLTKVASRVVSVDGMLFGLMMPSSYAEYHEHTKSRKWTPMRPIIQRCCKMCFAQFVVDAATDISSQIAILTSHVLSHCCPSSTKLQSFG